MALAAMPTLVAGAFCYRRDDKVEEMRVELFGGSEVMACQDEGASHVLRRIARVSLMEYLGWPESGEDSLRWVGRVAIWVNDPTCHLVLAFYQDENFRFERVYGIESKALHNSVAPLRLTAEGDALDQILSPVDSTYRNGLQQLHRAAKVDQRGLGVFRDE